MPNRPTMTCADCNRPMWTGSGSLPQGQARCLDCRRASPAPKYRPRPRRSVECRHCGQDIPAERNANSIYCSPLCKVRAVNARRADVPRRQKRSPEFERRKNARRRQLAPVRSIDRLAIYERDGWRCGICSDPVDPDAKWPDRMSASLDHVVPVARGGLHVVENLQLAHLRCNARKGARVDSELLPWSDRRPA